MGSPLAREHRLTVTRPRVHGYKVEPLDWTPTCLDPVFFLPGY